MKKHKAFIGAAIGAVGSIVSGLFNAAAKRREQRKQLRAQNATDTMQAIDNLESAYTNNDDIMQSYNDRISIANFGLSKKLRKEIGGDVKLTDSGNNNIFNKSDIANGVIGAVGNITSNALTTPTVTPQHNLVPTFGANTNYSNRDQLLRLGGYKCKKFTK